MKTLSKSFILILIFLASSVLCQVDYSDQIQPIFNNNCTMCHGSSGGLDLSEGVSYYNLVDVISQDYAPSLRVAPGSATNSVLWNKVANTGTYGSAMPQGSSGLNANEAQLIETWINNGAMLENSPEQVVKIFQINPIYPNPFNPSATISWEQPISENVQINIFNLKGELSDEFLFIKNQPGAYNINWHPSGLPAGIYLIRISGETFTVTQRAVYLK